MTLNDLGTVMEHRLPIKIALMNDGRQQMVTPGPRAPAECRFEPYFARHGLGGGIHEIGHRFFMRVDHELL